MGRKSLEELKKDIEKMDIQIKELVKKEQTKKKIISKYLELVLLLGYLIFKMKILKLFLDICLPILK
ncbi:hypothetical protein [Fusobacterium sp.]|uniref:hypothetical protein n=1 Tax=Fusobacterium sp. TaxID=68766 RepID=UPI0028FFE1F9|nr:hypothetical protein [Fusobacterium sp.]MDU1912506.1 hypothetical protein [Fusobacterium sp.]